MSRLLTRTEATDIFSTFAYAYKINFYSDFDIDFIRYKGLFEDPNRNENNIVRFSICENELTIDFVDGILRSVREAFGMVNDNWK